MRKSLLKKLVLSIMICLAEQEGLKAQTDFVSRLNNETDISSVATSFTSLATINENGTDVPYLAYTEGGNTRTGGNLLVKKYSGGAWVAVGGIVIEKSKTYTTSAGTITISASVGPSYVSLKADANGKLYVIFQYDYTDETSAALTNQLGVMTYDTKASNPAWSFVGGVASLGKVDNPVASTAASSVPYLSALTVNNSIPYVVYGDVAASATSGYATVKYFNNGVWSVLGGGAINSTDRICSPDIRVAKDTTYVLYHTTSSTAATPATTPTSTAGQIKVYSFANNAAGAIWTDLAVPASVTSTLAGGTTALATSGARSTRLEVFGASNGTKVYVTYTNTSSGSYPNIIAFDKASAAPAWLSGGAAASRTAAYNGSFMDGSGNVYLAYRANSGTLYAYVHKFTRATNTWSELYNTSTAGDVLGSFTTLAGNNSSLFLGYTKTYPVVREALSVLPVKISSFTAKTAVTGVEVKWTTSSEENSDKFIVEKSVDGVNFTKLTEVKSKGTSAYSVTDNAPAAGTNYYRLVQFDANGTSEVFGPVSVNFSLTAQAALVVYPNPASGDIRFKTTGFYGIANVVLTDVQGKVIYKEVIQNITSSEYKLNIGQVLPAGNYVLQVSSNGVKQTSKVIVL